MWFSGLKVFVLGFGGVFTGLVILMISVMLMSAVIKKVNPERHAKGKKTND